MASAPSSASYSSDSLTATTRGMARLTIPRDTCRPVRWKYTSAARSRPNRSSTPSESPSVVGSPTARVPAAEREVPVGEPRLPLVGAGRQTGDGGAVEEALEVGRVVGVEVGPRHERQREHEDALDGPGAAGGRGRGEAPMSGDDPDDRDDDEQRCEQAPRARRGRVVSRGRLERRRVGRWAARRRCRVERRCPAEGAQPDACTPARPRRRCLPRGAASRCGPRVPRPASRPTRPRRAAPRRARRAPSDRGTTRCPVRRAEPEPQHDRADGVRRGLAEAEERDGGAARGHLAADHHRPRCPWPRT